MAHYMALDVDQDGKYIPIEQGEDRKKVEAALRDHPLGSYLIVKALEEIEVGEPARATKVVLRKGKSYNPRKKKSGTVSGSESVS